MTMTAEPTASERPGGFRRLAGGPGRRLALGVAVGFIALIGGTIWKMRSLDGLPDVGDPFDVAEMRRPVEIPDADNAFVAYAAASRKLVHPADADRQDPMASVPRAALGRRPQGVDLVVGLPEASRIPGSQARRRWRSGGRGAGVATPSIISPAC